ncbi:MAG: ROK family protein [Alphaproteobacteria bacterium]|nr:ROK family protein [Alphaproteobacteria bacterium]
MRRQILLADMGGTHIRFEANSHPAKVYNCADFASPYAALKAFYKTLSRKPQVAFWGCPQPKKMARGEHINTTWRVSAAVLKRRFGLREVYFYNDFEAAAWGVIGLEKKDQIPLTKRRMNAHAVRVVMGAGTGFGVAIIGDQQHVLPSEAGHASLPLYDPQDAPIYECAKKRYGRVSVERILSGSGVELIYQALGGSAKVTAPQIAQKAQNKDRLAMKTFDRFFAIWGGVAGDLALQANATGGVGLTCGIIEQDGMWALLKHSDFMKMFCAKGRLSSYMKKIPVCGFSARFVAIKGLRRLYRQKYAGDKKKT